VDPITAALAIAAIEYILASLAEDEAIVLILASMPELAEIYAQVQSAGYSPTPFYMWLAGQRFQDPAGLAEFASGIRDGILPEAQGESAAAYELTVEIQDRIVNTANTLDPNSQAFSELMDANNVASDAIGTIDTQISVNTAAGAQTSTIVDVATDQDIIDGFDDFQSSQ
jgi:hypothetical protein